jgi:tetratricopeptide (TPR) repeat protein
LARTYERLGRSRLQTKDYDRAVAAFRQARETLLQSDDPDARHQAVRLNWNLSELAATQERWNEALTAIDAYLEHAPADIEPYERKVEWLRRAGRERDVVPALKRYAEREQHHINLQLLLAREMAKDQRTRRDAEQLYLTLLKKNIKPEVYRGLFKLYLLSDEMKKVIDLFDEALRVTRAKDDDAKPDVREEAAERARAILAVLRSEPEMVSALIPWALVEADRAKPREFDTWQILAALAARTRKLPEAERFFRQCLTRPLNHETEYRVYSGLIEVLMLQKKHGEVIALCRSALDGPKPARNTNAVVFEASLATALAEQGKFDDALDHADRAIRLSSEEAKVRQRCHRAEILARAERFNDAIRECTDTMKEFPQQARVRSVRYTLSTVYSYQGEHAKSEEQLRLILEDDPDAPLANNNLGYQLADRNVHLDEAERLIRRAIDNDRVMRRESGDDSDNAAYLDSLGWVLFRQGKLDEAREWLEKAIALPDGADDPTVWDHLGDVYARLDLPGKAKEAWSTAIKRYDAGVRRKSDTRRAEVDKKLKTLNRQ